jgi:hypothetical protein
MQADARRFRALRTQLILSLNLSAQGPQQVTDVRGEGKPGIFPFTQSR